MKGGKRKDEEAFHGLGAIIAGGTYHLTEREPGHGRERTDHYKAKRKDVI